MWFVCDDDKKKYFHVDKFNNLEVVKEPPEGFSVEMESLRSERKQPTKQDEVPNSKKDSNEIMKFIDSVRNDDLFQFLLVEWRGKPWIYTPLRIKQWGGSQVKILL